MRRVFGFRLRRRALILVSCGLALVWSSAAYAALNDPLARDLKQRGDQAMEEGSYEAALDNYEKATAIEADPSLLYNRARALSALNRPVDALNMYEAFERAAPDELKARVPQLTELIERARLKVSFVHFELPEGDLRVYVGGAEVIEPRAGEKRFAAGEAQVRIVLAGYEVFERGYALVGGQELTIAPQLIPLTKTGVLHVTSQIAGAEVLVDGSKVGNVPVDITLDPGTHDVVLRHSKYQSVRTSSIVAQGKTTHLAVDMERKPLLVQRWWFWTAIGTAVATGVTIAIVATTERKADSGDIPPGTITVPGS